MAANRRSTMVEFVEQRYRGKVSDDKFELLMELARESDARTRMLDILYEDTRAAFEELGKNEHSQYNRRTFVRTIFAHIEAQLSIMRQAALTWHRLGAIKLSDTELRKLADEIRAVWDPSQVPVKPIRLRLIDSIKFTFGLYGLTPTKTVVAVDTTSQGWQSFVAAVNIRDNLMHPKTEQNLVIGDAEIMNVIAAWSWYSDLSSLVFRGG